MGNAAILDRPMVALLCSEKCPGKLILDTYDLAKLFRKQGVTVNGHDAQPRHRRIATTFCDHSVVTKTRLKPCTAQPRSARDHSQHYGRFAGLSSRAALMIASAMACMPRSPGWAATPLCVYSRSERA